MPKPLVHLKGAASIPAALSQVHLSYNLAGLEADDLGVQIHVRNRVYARFFALVGLPKVTADDPKSPRGWATRWPDIERVVTSEKSIVFYPRNGRGCRFAAFQGRRLEPLIAMVDARGIPRERVTSTIGRGYRL